MSNLLTTFFLLTWIATMTTGQVCITRYLDGEWRKFGDCQSEVSKQDVMASIKEMAREERAKAVENLPMSCNDVTLDSAKTQNLTGGVFDIYIPTAIGWNKVYCDMTTDGGSWIVFQRRMDGSVDFYRNWVDYVDGFGDVTKEFWLGLEAMHQLTKHGLYELRIDMTEIDGTRYYAKYSTFKVGPRSDKYRLTVSGYSGNASDAFANPPDAWGILNGQQFSTKDADNDIWEDHCAVKYTGAWWYKNCLSSNLNGVYSNQTGWGGVTWYDSLRRRSHWRIHMKFTEMKIRRLASP